MSKTTAVILGTFNKYQWFRLFLVLILLICAVSAAWITLGLPGVPETMSTVSARFTCGGTAAICLAFAGILFLTVFHSVQVSFGVLIWTFRFALAGIACYVLSYFLMRSHGHI